MSKKQRSKRSRSKLLAISVRVIVFVMLFSVIGVIGIYINGISQQNQQQAEYDAAIQAASQNNNIQIGDVNIITGSTNTTGSIVVEQNAPTITIGSGDEGVTITGVVVQ